MKLFQRRGEPHMLIVGMTGVKMGDRLVQIGCAQGGRLAALAGKVGLSGHALAIVPDEASAARVRKGAAQAGVHVEIKTAPSTQLPVEAGTFDLAVFDDTAALFAGMRAEDRVASLQEVLRILRPGGRVMVIGGGTRGRFGAWLTCAQSGLRFDALPVLQAEGFKSVRNLAEREGLIFVEGVKSRA